MAETAVKAPAGLLGGRRVSDPWVLMCALLLVGIGLVMVYSASSALALKRTGDAAFFFKAHLVRVLLGLAVMVLLAGYDYLRLRRWTYPLLGLVFLALLLVLIPGVGHTAGGATRWLRLAGVSLQPSELAKLALVIYLAYYLSKHQDQVKTFSRGMLPPLGVAMLMVAPVLLEPDLGISITLVVLAMGMLFVAGARLVHLALLAAAGVPVLYLLLSRGYWLDRMLSFLSPWKDPSDTGFQIIHSFLAFGSGGVMGAGLGASKQKLFYLPEPHTDFIFSVLGEELGLWGVLLVLAIFMVLVWRGLKIALEAGDLFGSYLALGCTLIVGLQAFVNAGVVMGLLPTKGLTLPFISYGGSSLITNFACVGILLSVAGHSGRRP